MVLVMQHLFTKTILATKKNFMPTPSEIHQAKILIVDDLAANISLLEKLLANIGYQNVVSTLDPTVVCKLHAEHHFDLILLDLQMPVMDGFQVMEALKEIEPESYTPVLVITAQPAEKLRALQAGAKDFVSKPFELVELQTRIANMLEVRLLYKKLENYNQVLEKTVEERTRQLKESEARFKSFTKLSSDWYWEQDAEGNYVSVSGPVFDMLGVAETGQATSTQTSSSESNFDEWNQAEYTQLRGKIEDRTPFLNYVYSLIKSDGSRQFLQVSGEPIFDEGGRFCGYRGIGMELNDRRRTDTELMRLRSAFNCIEQAVFIFDRDSAKLVDINQSACQLFDIPYNDLESIDLDYLGFVDLNSRREQFFAMTSSNNSDQEPSMLRSKEGDLFPVTIRWCSYQVHDEQVVIALVSVTEALTVFDGLD
jgi:PAS domain S-box-containing protein